MDTIYALSSGNPPAGVAVIRVSGRDVRNAVEALAGTVPQPRRASLRSIRDRNGSILDEGLVLFFPGPNSFTGEDCVEFHVHGGRATVMAVLVSLSSLEGLREAEPGEFTRRAFENGRMDLTAVEGLADLIAAQTEMQRRLAHELAQGGLSSLYDGWAERLTRARAMIEAALDFADEEDVPVDVADEVAGEIAALRQAIAAHLEEATIGERIRDGFRIVLAGAPNSGKSSLLNALARRDVAIVSEEAGTTRDIISVEMDIAGYAVTVSDTAGLRETGAPVEREGIRRANQAIADADLVLHLVPADETNDKRLPANAATWIVRSKADLAGGVTGELRRISATTGEGINALIDDVRHHLETRFCLHGAALPNRTRHRNHLETCLRALDQARDIPSEAPELRAESLRLAGECLGRITGKVETEDLLDVIFAQFCIGK